MKSRDQKYVALVRKWLHAVPTPLAIILIINLKSLAQELTEKIRFL